MSIFRFMTVITAAGMMMLALGGCEKRVVSVDYRPYTGLPSGDRSRNQDQDTGSWWDDLFGPDEPEQSHTTRPMWERFSADPQQTSAPPPKSTQ